MEMTSENQPDKYKKNVCVGLLAHVDAGKTTLSEAVLFKSGAIRRMGRVDNKDAFLDTNALERERGITIFSKQALFMLSDIRVTLLDTPGHVDFSAEMERTLQVLDYAVLVISGADGVQGHTQTLWRLLEKYQIPVFLFINKMDQSGTNKEALAVEIKNRLDDGCIDFGNNTDEAFYEQVAVCDEEALNQYMETDKVDTEKIKVLIKNRKVFPCFFGSALKLEGIEAFIRGIEQYVQVPLYPNEFGAKIFKITRDEQGSRLTHMKITGGSLKVRTVLNDAQEKVNQIRIYCGEKYETLNEAEAGTVCAVTGLSKTRPGEGAGTEQAASPPLLEPVLTYQIQLPKDCEVSAILPKLRQLEEEEPELHIVWNESLQEIQAQVMGEVQIEILKRVILERFGIDISFRSGNILYKETIADTVEGVGHFEPLRHYAEVHLILEAGRRGSGLQFFAECSEDLLDKNWQRLILTHLQEKEHRGVLTGSVITDMKITLVSGKAHQKHTEGGDFRQATYRAVRHGLKHAQSVLLEPYYEFRLEVPEKMTGRAMTDIERMYGKFDIPEIKGETAILHGEAPVATMREYQKELIAYTKGCGRIFCSVKGYRECHNTKEVLENTGYDSEKDLENPTGSVFCSHGAGFAVPWNQVNEYMHLESRLSAAVGNSEAAKPESHAKHPEDKWLEPEEIDQILNRTFYANRKENHTAGKGNSARRLVISEAAAPKVKRHQKSKEEYLLVDGYNIIFAWEDLKALAEDNIDGARGRLMDILCNYQGIRNCNLILVFDAYQVEGHAAEMTEYQNIQVVYTKEAETADQYIEKFAHKNGRKYEVTVATSDALEQIIIRGQDCRVLSARELQHEIKRAEEIIYKNYAEKQPADKNYLFDSLSKELTEHLEDIRLDKKET